MLLKNKPSSSNFNGTQDFLAWNWVVWGGLDRISFSPSGHQASGSLFEFQERITWENRTSNEFTKVLSELCGFIFPETAAYQASGV